jgi:hypothetical protein
MKLGKNKVWLLAVGLLVACGDDGGSGEGDTEQEESAVTGESDAGTASCITELEPLAAPSSDVPDYTCDASPSSDAESANACRNAPDCELIATDRIRHLAKNCALTCRDNDDCGEAAECNGGCLANDTMNQFGKVLSDGCSACYEQVALCMLEKCYAQCAADPDAPACVECSFDQGCRLPFERCSGLDRKS